MENGVATDKTEMTVELKVCERCGGLWLRPAMSGWVYCGPCKKKTRELPSPEMKPAGRKQKRAARLVMGSIAPVAAERGR